MRRDQSSQLVGWLFADALLALTLIGLASGNFSEPQEPSDAVPVGTPSASSAAPTPTAPPTDVIAVSQDPVVVELPLAGASDDEVRARVSEAVAPLVAEQRHAAFVLTFGTASRPSDGTTLARRVNAQLDLAAAPLFEGSAKRDFWKAVNAGSPPAGTVRIEMFLVQT